MEIKKCAVIGSGLGGLAASIRLAAGGVSVDIFEKNPYPGGKTSQISENGFRFDSGPSVLTMPFVLAGLFESAGDNIDNYLKLKKIKINCKYFYHDGTVINAYSDQDDFIKELISKTSEKEENIRKYFDQTKIIYDLTAPIFLFSKLWKPKQVFNSYAFKNFLKLNKRDLTKTMHESNSKYLSDERVIKLFDRYATYNGSNPYTAPSVLNIINYVENGLGTYIPEKGVNSITEALYNLAVKFNVKFNFNSEVKRINTLNRKVIGLKVRNEDLNYDFIISNADVNFTYDKLLNIPRHNSKVKRQEPSSSALVFYWGVKGNYKDLEIHNILFSENYEKEFEQIFEKKVIPEDPTIYIYISSKFNKTDAPEGYENWFVMVNSPYNRGQHWDAELISLKAKVLKRLKEYLGIDLKEKIVFEKTLSPKDIEDKTNSEKGSIYGASSNSKYSAFFRHQNKSKIIDGLYFTGGSVHPGGGIPLVLLSAKIAAELITKYELN
jgi:phytoene desaturase